MHMAAATRIVDYCSNSSHRRARHVEGWQLCPRTDLEINHGRLVHDLLKRVIFWFVGNPFPQGLFIRSLRRRGKGVSSSRAARAQGGDNRFRGGSPAARSNQAFEPENLERYPRKVGDECPKFANLNIDGPGPRLIEFRWGSSWR